MRKILLGIISLLLIASAGYCQEPSLQLTIKPDKEIYRQGEEIKLSLTFRNTSKKRISICLFDIEHKLSEGLRFKSEGKIPPTYRLKDWTKRKLPIVTGEDFIFLEPQEEYNIELIIDIVIPSDSSWRYIYDENEHTWKWGEGLNKLLIGKYQIVAKYENSIVGIGDHGEPMQKGWRNTTVIIEAHNAWTGTLTSNTITIEVVEKKGISKEEALKIAEEVCKKEGWEWVEVGIFDRETHWEVRTHYLRKGGNASILIDKKTGKILDKGWGTM